MEIRFADQAQTLLVLASEEAKRRGDLCLGSENLLVAMLEGAEGLASKSLRNLDVSMPTVSVERNKLTAAAKDAPLMRIIKLFLGVCAPFWRKASVISSGEQLPATPRLEKVFELAMEEAERFGKKYVDTEHLLLGIARDSECTAFGILSILGISYESVREEVFQQSGDAGLSEAACPRLQ